MKVGRRNVHNLRYREDTLLLAESSSGLKRLLGETKEESAKGELQWNIKKTTIMTIEEQHNFHVAKEKTEMVKGLVYLGSTPNTNGDCCQEIGSVRRRRAVTKERDHPV